MDTSDHSLSTLFAQLGLDNQSEAIENFFKQHKLDKTAQLTEASFWNEGQRHFLEEALADDSDWTEQVDILDARLRH